MKYTQGITIDGTYYDVPLVSLKRTGDFLDKYANRTEDGDMKRELIGLYYNYQLTFGVIEDTELYGSLYDKLTEPVEFHDLIVPTTTGQYSFKGYISSVSDEADRIYTSTTKFKNLSCKFTAKAPARTPS